MKLLEERKFSLAGKEKFSLLRLENVSAIGENEEKKMLRIKGKMIVKNQKIVAIDFVSWIPSQIILRKDFSSFQKKFARQRRFGFYWWKVMLATTMIWIAIPTFYYILFAYSIGGYHSDWGKVIRQILGAFKW